MEFSTICERCTCLTTQSYLFTCNHTLCSQCITRILYFNHFKELSTKETLTITCQCKTGTKEFSLVEIMTLLSDHITLPTCSTHKILAKLECPDCDSWLCHSCIEIHKDIYPFHKFRKVRRGLSSCTNHTGQQKELYCHDCQDNICKQCTTNKDAKHFGHKVQPIKEYTDQLRSRIPFVNLSNHMSGVQKGAINFKENLQSTVDQTLEKFELLFKQLEESKQIYMEKMKQTFQRADIHIKLMNFIYEDLKECLITKDINLLKDLSTMNCEVIGFNLVDETENRVGKIQLKISQLKEYVDTWRAQPIQVAWKNTSWINTQTLSGHEDYVSSIVQMKDGRIASASNDATIKIWEVKGKEYKNTMNLNLHDDYVCTLILLEDGRLASGSGDKTIKIWKVKKNDFKNTLTLTGHGSYVLSLIQLNDGRIVSGSGDTTIKIWELGERKFQNTITLTGHLYSVLSLLQLKDERIASGSGDYMIKIWERKEKNFMNTLTLTGHSDSVFSLVQLVDERIISGSGDKTIKVWKVNVSDFINTLTLSGHRSSVNAVIALKDGRIASGSNDEEIKVWEVNDGGFENTVTLVGHSSSVKSLIQLQDGRIVSGSNDNSIKIWQ